MPPARVIVRVRPPTPGFDSWHDAPLPTTMLSTGTGRTLSVGGRTEVFDGVLGPSAGQAAAYEACGAPAVESLLRGQPSAIVLFGAYGAGKTHTCYGSPAGADGLAPRAIADVMKRLHWREVDTGTTFTVEASYFEVYNDTIRDLLVDASPRGGGLRLHDRPYVHVSNLTRVDVRTGADVDRVMRAGASRRTCSIVGLGSARRVAARSHGVFVLVVGQTRTDGTRIASSLTIVDLAAAAHSTSSDRDRGRVAESRSINASMSTFKACIVALSAHRQFVPVMESKLTRVLRDVMACAGCMTTFVACVSEMAHDRADTLATIELARRARLIGDASDTALPYVTPGPGGLAPAGVPDVASSWAGDTVSDPRQSNDAAAYASSRLPALPGAAAPALSPARAGQIQTKGAAPFQAGRTHTYVEGVDLICVSCREVTTLADGVYVSMQDAQVIRGHMCAPEALDSGSKGSGGPGAFSDSPPLMGRSTAAGFVPGPGPASGPPTAPGAAAAAAGPDVPRPPFGRPTVDVSARPRRRTATRAPSASEDRTAAAAAAVAVESDAALSGGRAGGGGDSRRRAPSSGLLAAADSELGPGTSGTSAAAAAATRSPSRVRHDSHASVPRRPSRSPSSAAAAATAAAAGAGPTPRSASRVAREDTAAVRIQAIQRGRADRSRVRGMRALDAPDAAATTSAAAAPTTRGGHGGLDESTAATRIQAVQRGRVDRSRVAQKRAEQASRRSAAAAPRSASRVAREDTAAVRIQAIQRGRADRSRVRGMRALDAPDAAATTSAAAAPTTRGGHGGLDESTAATRIQAVQRGRVDRSRVAQKRAEQASRRPPPRDAAAVDDHPPRPRSRMSVVGSTAETATASAAAAPRSASRVAREDTAAVRIQSIQRGRVDRSRVRGMRAAGSGPITVAPSGTATVTVSRLDESTAATRIQAVQRGRVDRSRVAQKRAEQASRRSAAAAPRSASRVAREDTAAVRIQSIQRGRVDRSRVAEKKRAAVGTGVRRSRTGAAVAAPADVQPTRPPSSRAPGPERPRSRQTAAAAAAAAVPTRSPSRVVREDRAATRIQARQRGAVDRSRIRDRRAAATSERERVAAAAAARAAAGGRGSRTSLSDGAVQAQLRHLDAHARPPSVAAAAK